ncbi:MAG: 1,4-alpha-glucan branching protein domain-containing protein [Thermosulfidibacteraceae bacterium]|jgi:1,4-alpha-glucan branching enzyme
MKKGKIGIVLHSHIPYVVNYGSWPHGTDWLYEACAETYIPLLSMLNKLSSEGIKAKITISFTPILVEQINTEEFKEGFTDYVNMKIKYANENKKEFEKKGEKELSKLADMWFDYYQGILEEFYINNRNIILGFQNLEEEGCIDILTSSATHAYLPLLKRDETIDLQIKLGVETYEKHFGELPKGIWLPECGYRPSYKWKPPIGDHPAYDRKGIEEFLYNHGIEFFFVDKHLIEGGKPIGTYISRFEILRRLWEQFEKSYEFEETKEKSVYKPYYVVSRGKTNGAICFGRDPKTALQVWSTEWGYPGDYRYLEFHKKHFPGGIKYWRITSSKLDLALKEPYVPIKAREAVKDHARHFVNLVKETLLEYYKNTGKVGILTSMYDTELFGHWWFEGIMWLEEVIRLINMDEDIELTTFPEYYEYYPPEEVVMLPEGSWGEGGFHYIWLNEMTKWTWERIYECEDIFFGILDELKKEKDKLDTMIIDVIKQFIKEFLFLTASDWQFLITTFSAKDYAEARFSIHYSNFKKLANIVKEWLDNKGIKLQDLIFVKDLIEKTPVFENIRVEELL